MPFAASGGCRIYYRLEGSGSRPLLVLVHSLGTDHGMWDLQLPALMEHFQVLRIDLRGHGASDVPPGEYSIAQLSEDVLAVTGAIGRSSFSYCGLSLGGMIGQWLGAHTTGVIERLILANTSPRMADPKLFEERRKLVLVKGMGAIEEAVMGRFFTAPALVSGNPIIDSIRTTLLTTDPTGYAGCCAAIRDMDQKASLSEIRIPVLVIGGDEDVSTPWVGHGEFLEQHIADAKAVLLHAAHLSNVEQPASFSSALLDFLLPAL